MVIKRNHGRCSCQQRPWIWQSCSARRHFQLCNANITSRNGSVV